MPRQALVGACVWVSGLVQMGSSGLGVGASWVSKPLAQVPVRLGRLLLVLSQVWVWMCMWVCMREGLVLWVPGGSLC